MTNEEHGLGRLEFLDDRSRNFQVFPLLMQIGATVPGSRTWGLGAQLNQGSSGRCVGYTAAAELAALPVRWPGTNELGNVLYELATKRDVWPQNDGPDINFGTNDVAVMKAMKELGFITEYRWCGAGSGRPLEDFALALKHIGPVLAGTDWLASMDTMGADGHLLVDPASAVRGGHEYLHYRVSIAWLPGTPPSSAGPRTFADVDIDASRTYVRNSWGGANNGWMTLREVGILQQRQGTYCIPLVRTRTS